MEQTSLRGIANKAAQNKAYRFRNLFGLLSIEFLFWCWRFVNKKASAGVDRIDANAYEENLHGNIKQLVAQVKAKTYRAKLVLRKYIPKLGGKLRPLGIPTMADKLLQLAVAKILEAIYEQDFLSCSYGYRPKKSAHDAVKDLSATLESGRYHYLVEADIKGFFNNIDHDLLLEMLSRRIDDKPFLNLIRKWLKAGILDEGRIINPTTGTPQGGIVSPILANIYLHHVLDGWFHEKVQTHCRGQVYLCRYADDFVCAFEYENDARRFYQTLKLRLNKFGLEVAEDKTSMMTFSPIYPKLNTRFEFLGFEFHWELSQRYKRKCWRKPLLKRRTSRKKLSASRANFTQWFKKNCQLPKKILFKKLNRKLRGYYNYYGIRGNYKSLNSFAYHITQTFQKWLNRRSQRKSYNWLGFKEMVKHFGIAKPCICHDF
ncbi:group II intron reverse transcriptase/maturase [Candidatus Venteria ishoeyi]|uniref:Group II intron-encoded protein LtrA n=1 Tax=Candidatus Venteria ishoeyi TaxID=1899563 RepID=A0A1H6FE47_9GAMM|nr:group II intron reverse transcriptase/maturase [Candidatus Venteria ishoeyi]SEH07923.1 Group II intron-encoded protein LtrA [Candidatus Venteria ishoeyi]